MDVHDNTVKLNALSDNPPPTLATGQSFGLRSQYMLLGFEGSLGTHGRPGGLGFGESLLETEYRGGIFNKRKAYIAPSRK